MTEQTVKTRKGPVSKKTAPIFNLHNVIPRRGFDHVPLSADVAAQCQSIIQEYQKAEELGAYDLTPRHKLLLPGYARQDKALIAEALAYELQLPLLRVNYANLVAGSINLARNDLIKIFQHIQDEPCVLFIDEFNGVGLFHNTHHDLTDIKAFNSQVATYIDLLPSTCLLVAATGAISMLEPAHQRSFDITLDIAYPTDALKLACAKQELGPAVTPVMAGNVVIERVVASGAYELTTIIELCRNIRRDLVLNNGVNIDSFFSEFDDDEDIKPFEDVEFI